MNLTVVMRTKQSLIPVQQQNSEHRKTKIYAYTCEITLLFQNDIEIH